MGTDYNLSDIVSRQKAALAELEREVKRIERSDLSRENRRLKEDSEQQSAAYIELSKRAEALSAQNANLKSALYAQMYNEKRRIATSWESKMDVYFRQNAEAATDELTALERRIRSRIDHMRARLQQARVAENDEIFQKLRNLSAEVSLKAAEARKQAARGHSAFSEDERAAFEALKHAEIREEQVLEAAKKNNIERFVGLNLFNSAGMLLLLFGVIAAGRYAYLHMSDVLRSVMFFAGGSALLLAGEILNRKRPNIVSIGMTAGGVGVLYAALAVSYFVLAVLGSYPALAVCLLITAAAFLLSMRYKSQTILAFALVGGYLPLLSLGSVGMIYGAMVYFAILNLLALLISFREKWSIAAFVGLGLNIAGSFYMLDLVLHLTSPEALSLAGSILLPRIITALYLFFAFLNYTMIPIVSTYRSKTSFRRRDVVFLAINSCFGSLLLFASFYAFQWQDFTGALSLMLAAVYLGLGYYIGGKFQGARAMQALFYITGLVFAVLFVPFQFDRMWHTFGWLLQGVGLTVYGILKERRGFQLAGFLIGGLCLLSFLFWDVLLPGDHLFAWKYLSVTLGSLGILGALLYKKTLWTASQKAYKYVVLVNLWFYTLYVLFVALWQVLRHTRTAFSMEYLTAGLALAATLLLAYALPRIRRLADLGTRIIACALYGVGIVWVFVLHALQSPVLTPEPSLAVALLGALALLLLGALSVFAVYDMMKGLVTTDKLRTGPQWRILIPSAYFVVLLSHILISQYAFSFRSPWLSILYVLCALGWIVLGFMKRYAAMRRFGLGLSLLAVGKLFLIDLPGLPLGLRILSYFALGISLVAISFIYQYFSRRFELKQKDLRLEDAP